MTATSPGRAGAFWRRLAYLGARHGPDAWVRTTPAFIGAGFAAFLPHERERVRRLHRRVLGRRSGVVELLDSARTFSRFAHCLAEALGMGPERAARARVVVRGAEHLDALAGGAVLATAHGAWDIAGALLVRDLGQPVTIVMAREEDAAARAISDDVRRRAGVEVVHVGASALDALPLLKRLREGGLVALQIDRIPAGARAVPVSLLGAPWQVPEGPLRLAARTQVPLVPVFSRRLGYYRYEVRVEPPIHLPSRPDEQALAHGAELLARALERQVVDYPFDWFEFGGGSA